MVLAEHSADPAGQQCGDPSDREGHPGKTSATHNSPQGLTHADAPCCFPECLPTLHSEVLHSACSSPITLNRLQRPSICRTLIPGWCQPPAAVPSVSGLALSHPDKPITLSVQFLTGTSSEKVTPGSGHILRPHAPQVLARLAIWVVVACSRHPWLSDFRSPLPRPLALSSRRACFLLPRKTHATHAASQVALWKDPQSRCHVTAGRNPKAHAAVSSLSSLVFNLCLLAPYHQHPDTLSSLPPGTT